MSRLTPLLQKLAQTPVVQSAQQRWAQLAVREQNLVKGLGAVIIVAVAAPGDAPKARHAFRRSVCEPGQRHVQLVRFLWVGRRGAVRG